MRSRSTHLKLAIMGIAMVGLLTACFRQADTEPLQPQSLDSQIQQVQPTIAILDPNLEQDTDETPLESPDETPTQESVPEIIVPDDSNADTSDNSTDSNLTGATPTIIIIVPATRVPQEEATPTPIVDSGPGFVATATSIQIITPQAPAQLNFPTATAVSDESVTDTDSEGAFGPAGNGLVTPTDLPLQLNESCTHTVARGENLFRIAINNDVTLAALLSANNLTENSVIQPGQVLVLPDCTEQDQATAPIAATSPVVVTTPGAGGTTTHIVASGETLAVIAQRYKVTIADIVAANNLSNPNQLSIGQSLIIPLTQ